MDGGIKNYNRKKVMKMYETLIEGDTTIFITRGDSRSIPLKFELDDGSILPFNAGDIVYLTVKDSASTSEKQMQITVDNFPSDVAIIDIHPEHTKNLRCKKYGYDIQITRADGTVTTIIPSGDFIVGEEYTYE